MYLRTGEPTFTAGYDTRKQAITEHDRRIQALSAAAIATVARERLDDSARNCPISAQPSLAVHRRHRVPGHNSNCWPSSTTRLGGSLKNDVAPTAFREMTTNKLLRQ